MDQQTLILEETMIKELDAATRQLHIWWGTVKADSYPKRLHGKIMFLRGYLKAIRNLRDEKILGEAVTDLKQDFWRQKLYKAGFIQSKGDV